LLSSGNLVKGAVVAVTGDDLGSHGTGGFTENFSSSEYICRYCDCSRADWSANGTAQGNFRTKDTYDATIDMLQQNPQLKEYTGIKEDSVFHCLKYFHACQPGLPPCLAHDLLVLRVLWLMIWH
jgi:hypothetical protein